MLSTIKEKVFLTFQALFPAEMYQMSQAAVTASEKERRVREDVIERAALEVLIGKPVIAVGNDWSNPVIGVGIEIQDISKANRPHLVIKDYLSGEEVMPFGAVMEYNDVRLEAVLKLTPAEITSLVYRYSTPQTNVNHDSIKRDSREVILQKLTDSGFFEKVATLSTEE